jgi:hydroxymethylbilane synthase
MTGSSRALRVGTRGSALALAQSTTVAERLSAAMGVPVDLVTVRTQGDDSAEALATIGGTGVFVSALRERLLDGTVDLAVHSLKDLPTGPANGIALAAVPERENPSDALVARDGLRLSDLPQGATVGTGSPRRAAQLKVARPDLQVRAIRGNVDTRVGLVRRGELDAVVLAAAGLARLGRSDEVTELLTDDVMLPAPAQGALAIECRLADRASSWFASAVARLDQPVARAEVTAERNLLAALEAGCSAPVGARARVSGDTLALAARVVDPDSGTVWAGELAGASADAARLGRRLAERLLADGASDLLGGAER